MQRLEACHFEFVGDEGDGVGGCVVGATGHEEQEGEEEVLVGVCCGGFEGDALEAVLREVEGSVG